ncbi:hypothetical protein [Sporosalibacterium faouarense]|uniref:hypothetical protein n=1 Tax=Sporosalibacterium faouarense TaxID=516123 RepID=UPI00192CC2E5|nr:hypothetical protein [Sporosalibacterium faouarense]
MKKSKLIKVSVALVLVLSITACSAEKDGNRTVIKESDKIITIIEDDNDDLGEIKVSVEKIEQYKDLEISDWLDDNTVIISKENESLEKMRLEELADLYPKSLYLYNLDTKEYELIKEKENMFLGGANLSPDKRHVLYYGNTLGDPSYYIMDIDNQETFRIFSEEIGAPYSAEWTSEGSVIGASYNGGAYLASTSGEIAPLIGLEKESLFIVREMKEWIYYNTNSNTTLMRLNQATKAKISLNINHAYRVFPAPDGSQILVLQDNGSTKTLILCDANGENMKTIAEGTELNGVSWSPDQQMIAYSLKEIVNGRTSSDLYIYSMLTNEATKIVVDVGNIVTCWSPSGKALAYTEWNDSRYNSSIVYLKQSLQE